MVHGIDPAWAMRRAAGEANSPSALGESPGLAMLRQVVATARTVLGADAVAILLYEPERARFVPVTPRVAMGLDERWLQSQGLEAAQSLAVRAALAHEIDEVLDTAQAPELEFPLLAGGHRPGAVVAAPLDAAGGVIGVLEFYYRLPQSIRAPHDLLHSFASLAAGAVTAAWGHERERSLRLRLEVLDAATKAVAAELSLDQVLRRIIEAAVTVVGCRYGALGVLGTDGSLADFITVGISQDARARLGPLPRGHGLLGALIREGAPLRVPDIGGDPRSVGFPPGHPPMSSLLGAPVRVRGVVVGDLYLTNKVGAPAFSLDDERLLELLAAHAGIAIENAHLHTQLGELTQQRERDRIARDLHDGIIQEIYAAILQLDDAAEDVQDARVRERLLATMDGLTRVIGDIRTYIQGLRARELAGQTLAEGLADVVGAVQGLAGLAASWHCEGEVYALTEECEIALLQIAREALSNTVKHAGARRVEVLLRYSAAGVTLTVTDDGRGFDANAEHGEGHFGLLNLRARAAEVGGRLEVRSAPGTGATIAVSVPAAGVEPC